MKDKKDFLVEKTDEEWRELLDEETYRVTRLCGTEPPFSGKYNDHKEEGTYQCAACGSDLFDSETKYDSRSGWPSFYDSLDPTKVAIREDRSHGMTRMEVLCARCGAHLGHVFPDGPPPTGTRFCINSLALDFRKREK